MLQKLESFNPVAPWWSSSQFGHRLSLQVQRRHGVGAVGRAWGNRDTSDVAAHSRIDGSKVKCEKESYTLLLLCFVSLGFIMEKTFLQTDPLRFLPGCHCRVRIAVSCLVCHAALCHQRDRPPGCRRPSASSKPSERRQRLDTPKKYRFSECCVRFSRCPTSKPENKAKCASALRRPTPFQWQQEMR